MKHYNTYNTTRHNKLHFKWLGRKSFIVEHSAYLNNLLPGDVVLADRGFDVADSVAMLGATLDIPAFTRGCKQLQPSVSFQGTRGDTM